MVVPRAEKTGAALPPGAAAASRFLRCGFQYVRAPPLKRAPRLRRSFHFRPRLPPRRGADSCFFSALRLPTTSSAPGGWAGCRSGGAPTPHNEMQGRRQADGAMISRALRGKCPLSFYNQGKGATRKSPRGRTAIRAAPPCCPCLVSCAFPLLPPLRCRT